MKQCIPDVLKDPNFASQIITEESVQRWLALLLKNVNEPATAAAASSSPAPSGSTATLPQPAVAGAPAGPPPGVTAPPALTKAGPPGVAPPGTLNYAATFKRENGAGWNT